MSEQDGKPMVACPACGDAHEAPDGDPLYLERNIVKCSECCARIVYGKLALCIVPEPHDIETTMGVKPGFKIRFQDPKTREDLFVAHIDPQHAFLLAQAIIASVRA